MRDDWLRAGLSTQPADTVTAEAVVTELYRLLGQPKPTFEWVSSPAAALRTGASRPGFRPGRLGGTRMPATGRDWPTAARLASLLSDLRDRLDDRISQAQQSVGGGLTSVVRVARARARSWTPPCTSHWRGRCGTRSAPRCGSSCPASSAARWG